MSRALSGSPSATFAGKKTARATAAELAEDHFCNMGPQTANPVLTFYESNNTRYEFTATEFIKTSRLPVNDPFPDGTPFIWFRSWNHERITNEAKALELVSQTKIPVPKLLDYGEYSDGRRYLVTEFISGVRLKEFLHRGCSMATGQKHTDSTPCETCLNQAYLNALQFIEKTVFPELAKLTSQERGIDGFVMHPQWLSPDTEPPWKGKESWKTLPLEKSSYVFQHGDLGAHNIMMNPETLQPIVLFDWEYAGYFPPGMERWPGSLDWKAYRERGDKLADAIAKFLPEEYIECYDKWDDKAELDKLIKSGELPHPNQLR
ncbi:hypothetical protein HYALB_00009105 [Hymenoscyphus albidus]|uniref:Aminoglycoside phosphotransferase domain-containing protein n=1 Tax=Hymenoscyphus albidus TaxID=595503 RepID=A0A9N9LPI9_9HELO|nr:hypothetical protein HYALB_00009105 [Hymenoscyphus albidus]